MTRDAVRRKPEYAKPPEDILIDRM